jgi:tetratricopeptide (TPR) repeat protein
MISGLRVVRDGVTLVTTDVAAVRIDVKELGLTTLELKSTSPRYPESQTCRVAVTGSGQELTVYVQPRPVALNLRFLWSGTGEPVPAGYLVEIRGGGYRDQARVAADGRVSFQSYLMVPDQEYQLTVRTPNGDVAYPVRTSGYTTQASIAIELKSTVTIRTKAGQEATRLELHRCKLDADQGRPPLASGTGTLSASLQYGEYYLRAMPAGVRVGNHKGVNVVANRPAVDVELDMFDPFERAEQLELSGGTDSAMVLYASLGSGHPRYHDSQKKLAFHHAGLKNWAQAAESCDKALSVAEHADDPYLYLLCGQVYEKAGTYDRCLELCGRAESRAAMAERSGREDLRTDSRYYGTLCLHQSTMKTLSSPAVSYEKKVEQAQGTKARWELFLRECGTRCYDAQDRLNELNGRIYNLQ